MSARIAGFLLLAAGATDCANDMDTAPAAVHTGILQVSITTSGPYPDSDGYLAALDDSLTKPVGVNGTIHFVAAPGRRALRLAGVATTCLVQGDNPRWVDLSPGATRKVALEVSCYGVSEWTGGFAVRVDNRGAGPAQGPFWLSLTAQRICLGPYLCTTAFGRTVSIAEHASVAVLDLPGGRVLDLTLQAPPNCSAAATNPTRITVIAQQIAPLSLEVVCR